MLAVAARLNPIAAEAPARKVLLKTVFLLLIQGSCTITGKREDSTSTQIPTEQIFPLHQNGSSKSNRTHHQVLTEGRQLPGNRHGS
jgi:hypothetical protein